jgi:hypothetical protein
VKLGKVEILNDPNLPVCSVVAPRTEEAPAAVTAEAPAEPEVIRKAKTEEEAEKDKKD